MDPKLRFEVLFNFKADDSWSGVYSGTKAECINYLAEELAVKRQSGHSLQYRRKHRQLFKIQALVNPVPTSNLFGEGLYGVPE